MGRIPRQMSPIDIQHVMIRGNNRQKIFGDDQDRRVFLNKMRVLKIEYGIEVYAYCLMENHVHLLIRDPNNNMSSFMQKLELNYARYHKYRYYHTGSFFEGRFTSKPIADRQYFVTVLRYILRNPEKAGLEKTEYYRWSSFGEYQRSNYVIDSAKSLQEIISDHIAKTPVSEITSRKTLELLKSKEPLTDTYFGICLFGSKETLLSYVLTERDNRTDGYDAEEFEDIPDSGEGVSAKDLPLLHHKDKKTAAQLEQLLGISDLKEVKYYSTERRNQTIRMLKDNGLSMREIGRLTGVSHSTVARILS